MRGHADAYDGRKSPLGENLPVPGPSDMPDRHGHTQSEHDEEDVQDSQKENDSQIEKFKHDETKVETGTLSAGTREVRV